MRLAQTPGLKILVHLGNGLRDLELLDEEEEAAMVDEVGGVGGLESQTSKK
jgi:hypothetical protein